LEEIAKLHLSNLLEVFTWRRADFSWFYQSLKAEKNLPAMGKFNPGQKLNILFTLVAYFLFAITGLWMWFQGSILLPWYLHLFFFFLAIPALSGHLYLALFHPQTRTGIRGIFTGDVPLSYMQHHHALMLEKSSAKDVKASLWMKYLPLGVILLFLCAFLLVWIFHFLGVIVPLERVAGSLKRVNETLLMPGSLGRGHHETPQIQDCYACHSLSQEVSDQKCLNCHLEVQKRITQGIGAHAQWRSQCTSCHSDHQGETFNLISLDPKAFNHQKATPFPLEGAHQKLDCKDCHLKQGKQEFLNLPFEKCSDCHNDIHQGQFQGETCTSCHCAESWKAPFLNFDHQKSAFPLLGKHLQLACKHCHLSSLAVNATKTPFIPYRGVSHDSCLACHSNPHAPALEQRCISCHQEEGWKFLLFSHENSSFPLKGKHREVACQTCHLQAPSPSTKGISYTLEAKSCKDCHLAVHQEEVSLECIQCHTEKEWKAILPFKPHQHTSFPLRGRHERVRCEECHRRLDPQTKEIVLRLAKFPFSHCNDCHQDPHEGQMRNSCEQCHQEAGWKGEFLRFDHHKDSSFALKGAHQRVSCQECHSKRNTFAQYVGIKFSRCNDCHQDPHEGSLGNSCTHCHQEAGWKGEFLRFNHQQTRFPLGQDHLRVSCQQCHLEANRYRGTEIFCSSCHQDITKFSAGEFEKISIPPSVHHPLLCQECHQDTQQKSTKDPEKSCSRCHSIHYESLYFDQKIFVHKAIERLKLFKILSEEEEKKILKIGAHHFPLAKTLLEEKKGERK
jgi:hypothetical protein